MHERVLFGNIVHNGKEIGFGLSRVMVVLTITWTRLDCRVSNNTLTIANRHFYKIINICSFTGDLTDLSLGSVAN